MLGTIGDDAKERHGGRRRGHAGVAAVNPGRVAA
jgi:hypothetical protein